MRFALSLAAACLLLAACVTDGAQRVDRGEAARANAELGLAYLQQGRPERAETTLQRAVELDASISQAWSGLGLIAMQRGELEFAESNYRRALDQQPDDANTRNQYGVLLCRLGRYSEGQQQLQTVLQNRRYESPEVAATNAAVCAQTAGDNIAARRYLNQALQISPNYSPALLEFARLNLAANELRAAADVVDRYLKQNPRSRAGLELGLNVAQRAGNTWAADYYASKLKSMDKQQPASANAPE